MADDVAPTGRRYELQRAFHRQSPILLDRDRLERRMTEELIAHAARDGVQIDPNTRLPGFSLNHFLMPDHVVARIELQVWQPPPDLARRLAGKSEPAQPIEEDR